MLYTIELLYQTGDSFNSEKRTSRIAMGWNKLAYAQDALERIYEHYAFVQYITDHPRPELTEQQFNLVASKSWFFDGTGDSDYKPIGQGGINKSNITNAFEWIHNLWVENDKGEPVRIYAFWHGHFENLEHAKIVIDSNDNEKEFGFFDATEWVENQLNNP